MSMSKRTLMKWRKEALKLKNTIDTGGIDLVQTNRSSIVRWQKRILQMTQILLDQHLIKGGK